VNIQEQLLEFEAIASDESYIKKHGNVKIMITHLI